MEQLWSLACSTMLLNLVAVVSAVDNAASSTMQASCLFQKGSVRQKNIGYISTIAERSHSVSVHDAEGPPMLIEQDEDPFLGSIRAMKVFDQNVTEECSKKYGKRMLESFRETKHAFCVGPRSNVTCHERVEFDIPRYMCELRHIEIFSNGARAEACQVSHEMQGLELGGCESMILKKLESQDVPLKCLSYINENALIQMPWDTRNFYEWYGDWITLWETLAVLEWQPKDVELFLLEALPFGNVTGDGKPFTRPFDEAWSLAFEKHHVHIGSFDRLFGDGVCFSRAVIVPHGGLSTMTFDGGRGGRIKCRSPTIMASILYLEALVSPLPKVPRSDRRVTLLLRNGTRSFDNDTLAEESVRSVLRPGWSLETFRPEECDSLAKQLAVAAETNVLVGTHGAGLTHLMFLPPKARVIEIFCGDRTSSNRHYANLGTMSGDAAPDALESLHLEASFTSCQVDSKVVRRAIEEYDKS